MAWTFANVVSAAAASVSGAVGAPADDEVVGAVVVEPELLLEHEDDIEAEEDEDDVQLVDVIELAGVDPEIELAMGSGESSGLSLCSSSLLAAVVAAAKENVSFYILSMLKNNSDYCWTMKMK